VLILYYWHKGDQIMSKHVAVVKHITYTNCTKTLITKKCTKRVLSSIATHSYMFRPCWVIFREKLFVTITLGLHFTVEWECAVDCVLCTGGVNCLQSGPRPGKPEPQRVHASSTQYTVNSTFSLNYKVQPYCNDNKKVLPEDDPAGSKHLEVCFDWW
jgi:hypothetical protein